MTTFSVNDAVLWKHSTCEEGRPATVTAVDTKTDPETYIILFENGEKKGSKGSNLVKIAGEAAAPKKEGNLNFMKGRMKGLFGSVSETVKGIASTAKSTVAGNTAGKKQSASASEATAASAGETADPEPEPGDTKEERKKKIKQLIDMGFDPQHSEAAIILSEGDMNKALAFLADQCGDGDGSIPSSDPEEIEEEEEYEDQQELPQQEEPQQQPQPESPQPQQQNFFDLSAAQPAGSGTVSNGDAFSFLDEPSPKATTAPPAPAPAPVSSSSAVDDFFGSPVASNSSPIVAAAPATAPIASVNSATSDAFDFLSATPTPAPPVTVEAPENPLSLNSAGAGCIQLNLKRSALAWCPEASAKVSVAVKSSDSKTWKHVLDCRTSRLVEFSNADPWNVTSYGGVSC
eukprot:TRINITY_DN7417_c0_g1_i1.p1 TRINITY_DN7417_c0_g1~~TRINITY_DN7417_c0_g1_i1.p1  ORF type:complete len:416 (+),score=100.95 TRINITY_DN7417_c0_g1_i1:40-1248(+)